MTGAEAARYTLSAEDVGTAVACRAVAVRTSGAVRARSLEGTSAPTPPIGPFAGGATGAPGAPGPGGARGLQGTPGTHKLLRAAMVVRSGNGSTTCCGSWIRSTDSGVRRSDGSSGSSRSR